MTKVLKGDLLARGYMPAHKVCEMFLQNGRSVLNYVDNGPGKFLGSYVINQMRTIRLVQ